MYVGPPEQQLNQLPIDESDSEGEYEQGEYEELIELEQPDLNTTLCTLQRNSALFLMGLKEERKLTQTALQGVVEGITSLTQTRLDALHTQVCGALSAAGITPSTVPGLEEAFDQDGAFGRPFIGFETQHQQLKFYRSHFPLVVCKCSFTRRVLLWIYCTSLLGTSHFVSR